MSIAQSMLPEFDHEMANTRKVLERIPVADAEWKPHAKSFAMGRLALHVATLPDWIGITVDTTELDVTQPWDRPTFSSSEELLALFDTAVAKARASLAGVSDADLMVNWTLRAGEQVIFTMPRVGVLRSFVMNHIIHHRAQLTVYLRLREIPVPGMYGPSADEM